MKNVKLKSLLFYCGALYTKIGDGSCTVDEFLTGDSELSVCVEMDDDNWDTRFLEELGKDQDSR